MIIKPCQRGLHAWMLVCALSLGLASAVPAQEVCISSDPEKMDDWEMFSLDAGYLVSRQTPDTSFGSRNHLFGYRPQGKGSAVLALWVYDGLDRADAIKALLGKFSLPEADRELLAKIQDAAGPVEGEHAVWVPLSGQILAKWAESGTLSLLEQQALRDSLEVFGKGARPIQLAAGDCQIKSYVSYYAKGFSAGGGVVVSGSFLAAGTDLGALKATGLVASAALCQVASWPPSPPPAYPTPTPPVPGYTPPAVAPPFSSGPCTPVGSRGPCYRPGPTPYCDDCECTDSAGGGVWTPGGACVAIPPVPVGTPCLPPGGTAPCTKPSGAACTCTCEGTPATLQCGSEAVGIAFGLIALVAGIGRARRRRLAAQ